MLGLTLSVLTVLPACKQGEGERCQINDDCAEGLLCDFAGNTPTIGGSCKNPNASVATVDMAKSTAMTPADMVTPADMTAPTDLSSDM